MKRMEIEWTNECRERLREVSAPEVAALAEESHEGTLLLFEPAAAHGASV